MKMIPCSQHIPGTKIVKCLPGSYTEILYAVIDQ